MASRYSRLNMRKKACEQINAMFGLNVDVEYREDTRMYDAKSLMENVEINKEEVKTNE